MNFIAFDFETANAKRSSACSLALSVVRDGQIVDELYSIHRLTFRALTPRSTVLQPKMSPMPQHLQNFGLTSVAFLPQIN